MLDEWAQSGSITVLPQMCGSTQPRSTHHPHCPRRSRPASLDKVLKQHGVQVAATQIAVPRVAQHLQLPLLQRHHAHLAWSGGEAEQARGQSEASGWLAGSHAATRPHRPAAKQAV